MTTGYCYKSNHCNLTSSTTTRANIVQSNVWGGFNGVFNTNQKAQNTNEKPNENKVGGGIMAHRRNSFEKPVILAQTNSIFQFTTIK